MSGVFIIAEAGVNHNGDIEIAKKLVDCAAEAGADCVKFQTFKAEELASPLAEKADYQVGNTGSDGSQLEMLKDLELSREEFVELKRHCDNRGIMFLSTPFDPDSADFLHSLGMPIFKIPSGEITDLPLLRKINSFKTDVILSTGMATMNEISEAVRELENCRVRLLHCTTEYPCPYCDVNMAAMLSMKEKFNLEVGYSDHTEGIEIPIMAAALGATIIEKHFTLDKRMKGPDHKASLSPRELADMVRAVRNVELAFGTGYKAPLDSETNNRIAARKSIVVKRPIKKGDLFSEENLTAKRPGNGISPMKWDSIIGSMAIRDYEIDEMI